MPYIAIKAWPKDEATQKELVERINAVLLEVWKCPQEAVSISLETVKPEDWVETVQKPEIEAHPEKMRIMNGKKMG